MLESRGMTRSSVFVWVGTVCKFKREGAPVELWYSCISMSKSAGWWLTRGDLGGWEHAIVETRGIGIVALLLVGPFIAGLMVATGVPVEPMFLSIGRPPADVSLA